MTDREQRQHPNTGMDQDKMRRDRVPHEGEVVGKDIPDESKERHTEIAVEVGRKVGGNHDDKH